MKSNDKIARLKRHSGSTHAKRDQYKRELGICKDDTRLLLASARDHATLLRQKGSTDGR